jgi:adenylate kinase
MSAGQLVPDELVIAIVAEKLQQPDVISKGWLLDGFPRTPAQATALAAAGVTPDVFLLLDVPDDALVERICFRRTDPVTGKIYHLKFNPPPEDVKDRLQHRSDDTEEALRTRLVQYHSNIDGIKGFYESVSVTINGHSEGASFKDNVARVQGELRAAIDSKSSK